ncbi:hypothetical protein RCC89_03610 [Cytophagaceae bacterium ABcell3]|nr:hypothetical protein RCC89_03610 [Cytophagaceae bacterium ABcell3]
MKKFSFFFSMLAIASVALFTSCSKDEDPKPGPTISFTPGDTEVTLEAGEKHKVAVVFSAEQRLNRITVFKKQGANETQYGEAKTSGFHESTKHTEHYELEGVAGETVTYRFQVEDRDGVSAAKSLTVKVKAEKGGEISSYSAKLLGGASNPNAGSFFATSTGTVMKMAEANENYTKVDFIYTYSGENGHLIAAPNDDRISAAHSNVDGWSSKNATKFKATSLTAEQFAAIDDDLKIVEAAEGANETRKNQLSKGQVFAFITEAGKKGVVHVKETAGTEASNRSITINVKVQK